MNWIFVALVANSIVTSGHDTEEACLGRKALLEQQKIYGVCVKAPQTYINSVCIGCSIGIPSTNNFGR